MRYTFVEIVTPLASADLAVSACILNRDKHSFNYATLDLSRPFQGIGFQQIQELLRRRGRHLCTLNPSVCKIAERLPMKELIARFRYPLLIALASRALLFLVVYLGLALIPVNSSDGLWRVFPDNLYIDGFARWDSGWYFQIAQGGYSIQARNLEGQTNTAFFPLYPAIISLASGFGWQGMLVLGITVSNVAFVLGICLLYDLSQRLVGRKVARLASCLAVFGPFSVFFSAVYTESLFFLATVASFWLAQKRWLYPAMTSAALAAVTRVAGALVIPFVLLVYLSGPSYKQLSQRSGRAFLLREAQKIVPALLIGVFPLALHLASLQLRFGNAFQFAISQGAWMKNLGLMALAGRWTQLLDPIRVASGQVDIMGLINSGALAISVILIAIGFFHSLLPRPMLAWSLLTILASSLVWISGARFASSLFPLYILASFLLQDLPCEIVIGTSAALMCLFALIFSHWYWVA